MGRSGFLGGQSRLAAIKSYHTKPRMERMRGEVRAIASYANQQLYWTECDGVAAFRRSFIGALVKNNNAGEGFTNQRMMAAPRPRAVRQPRRPYRMFKGLRLLVHVLNHE